ncbi:MAG: hypothetical protein GF364_13395 [Candidatus Lokiarchaeota archaeon]|nr:hypothetical protein [Candidatus Lokiarchaeota archaeon]
MVSIEEPGKTIPAVVFGLVFPLFGIFLYTQFDYMGVNFYNDIILQISNDFSYTMFQWLYSLFKGDMINQLSIHGVAAFFITPLMSAVLTWFLHGFFIGVFIKKLKPMFIVSVVSALLLILFLIIFAVISDASYNTLSLIFNAELEKFLGSLLVLGIFMPIGGILGYFTGR